MSTAHAAAQKRGARDVCETGELGTHHSRCVERPVSRIGIPTTLKGIPDDILSPSVPSQRLTATQAPKEQHWRQSGENPHREAEQSRPTLFTCPYAFLNKLVVSARPREPFSLNPWLSLLKVLMGTPSTAVKRYDGADQNPEEGGQSPYLSMWVSRTIRRMSSPSFASDELGVGRSGSVQCGGREGVRFFAKLASSGSGSCTSAFFVGKPTCFTCGIRLPVLKMANLGQRKGRQASAFLTKGHVLDRRLRPCLDSVKHNTAACTGPSLGHAVISSVSMSC